MTDYLWALGLILKPLGVLVIFVWFGGGIKWLIVRFMPECWFKRQLLKERWESAASESHRRITGGRY